MRFLYCAVIVFCSMLLGIEAAEKHKYCCKMIADMCGLCLHMQSCIRYEQTEPEMIMQSFISDSQLFCGLRDDILHGAGFHEAWLKMTSSGCMRMLTESEFTAVSEMGMRLGMCDCEGEIARLGRIYSQLEFCLNKRMNELDAKRRICLACGLLAGVFISIIII